MVRSFKDSLAEAVWKGKRVRAFLAFRDRAERKLKMLDAATQLRDLALPGNNLEKLAGDRAGQHSIRINDQWRVCFVWKLRDAYNVEIVDYH